MRRAESNCTRGFPVFRGCLVLMILISALLLSSPDEGSEQGAPRSRAGNRVEKGEALFRAGKFEEARAEFKAAASEDPRWVVPRYYLAYVDYKLGDFRAALHGFKKALALDPGDGWSRYMLGLTFVQTGDRDAARREFERIISGNPDPELEETTRSTLEELHRLPPAPEASRPSPWAVVAETGVAIDTNPAYLADRVLPGAPGTAVDALLRGAAEYRMSLPWNMRLFTGGQVYEQAILHNRQDADWTTASIWVGLARPGRPVSIQAEYGYEYSLFGGTPYLGTHSFSSAVELKEKPWTASRLESAVVIRSAQDSTFGYLESRELSLLLGQVFSVAEGALVITPSYALVRDWADDFSESFSLTSGSTTTQNVYRTNYSFLGHGPVLTARSRLPFEFHLSFRLSYLWKEFDNRDTLLSSSSMMSPSVRSKNRSDTRLLIDASLWRRLRGHWSGFLSFSSLDNASTLGDRPDDFIDRNYSRRMVSLGIRYDFP